MRRRSFRALAVGLFAVAMGSFTTIADEPKKADGAREADVGKSYRVPYRLSATNHFLVRVRIDGKGPFNFLVDTGAPAIFVSTEAAKKAGLKADPEAFWTTLDRIEFEGGASLRDVKVRVEDPYQLVGMNALGLPGASIDGLLGFTALARFRIELDPTNDRMTWTRLAFDPPDPPAPKRKSGAQPPAELQAMNALGAIARVAAAFVGRQPEDDLVPRGFLGIEFQPSSQGTGISVARVLPGSPAEKAGVRDGDRVLQVNDRVVGSLKEALASVTSMTRGDTVKLTLKRDGEPADLLCTVTAGEGF